MRISTRVSALFLVISTLFLLVACSGALDGLRVPQIDFNGETLDESYITESYIEEEFIVKGEMTSDEIVENRLIATRLIERVLEEDMVVEDISVNVVNVNDMHGLLDHYFTYEALHYSIDYSTLVASLVKATVITVVNAVVLSASMAAPVAIAIAVVGTLAFAAVGAAVGAIKASIESGGNASVMRKYAIEGIGGGAVFGAGVVSMIGALSGASAIASGVTVSTPKGVLGVVNSGMNIIDSLGEVVGYITDGQIALDIFGNALGKVDSEGNITDLVEVMIPSSGIINDPNGYQKYLIDEDKNVFDKAGAFVGFINDAGMIITPEKVVKGVVNAHGMLVSGVSEPIDAGFNIGLSGMIMNDSYVEDGYTYYLDDDGNVIGATVNTVDSEGDDITYLVESTSNYIADVAPDVVESIFGGLAGAIVGILNGVGQLISNWKEEYRKERLAAVTLAWAEERELVIAGGGTREWSEAEREELVKTGRVKGYEAHYINSPRHNPNLVMEPDNIAFLSPEEHTDALYKYNVDKPTYGALLNRSIMH